MYSLSRDPGLNNMRGGYELKETLNLGTYVIGLFSVIFLFYTNSFLIKRRKKEFGLFNILGMEKKHIAKIMAYETLYVSLISLITGLLSGIFFNKLVFLALLKLLDFEVYMGFEISTAAIISTLVLFSIIFILNLLNTLRQIHVSEPIELIKGGNVGEKEPKSKWIITIIGLLALGTGYYLSLTTTDPISAISLFFWAVILVIIGTYCLFTAGSITLLKALRKNKKYYYKSNHFISLSGMLYRMKQNAVGLANICVLSTMVLVMLSSTVSLFIGAEDIMHTRFPRELTISTKNYSENTIAEVKNISNEVLQNHGIEAKNTLAYRFVALPALKSGDSFITDMDTREQIGNVSSNLRTLFFIPLEDYNSLMSETITLNEDEILVFSPKEPYKENTLSIFDKTFNIKEKTDSFVLNGADAMTVMSSHYVIVKDMSVIDEIYQKQLEYSTSFPPTSVFYLGFDMDGDKQQKLDVYEDISASLRYDYPDSQVESRENGRDSFYTLYGGLFFLGIFLGVLFIMATILIIYYKQISEGYDDKERFDIMQKVGMSPEEIKSTIRSQVLTVFFLPLIVSVVHVAFAFPFITRLLAILGLTNVKLFAMCTIFTIGIFGVCYGILYGVTAKVYYKIVYSK